MQREAPIVLVSVDNSTREPLVNPQELARRLAGMARVVWLSTVAASRRFKDELLARGFSEKFGCFHGGHAAAPRSRQPVDLVTARQRRDRRRRARRGDREGSGGDPPRADRRTQGSASG